MEREKTIYWSKSYMEDSEERKKIERKIRRYGYYQVILLSVLVTGILFVLKLSFF